MRRTYWWSGIGCLLLASVLQSQAPGTDRSWRINEAPEELRGAISRADLLIVSMQSALLRELTDALGRGGPELAIKSCHVDVAGITERIARQRGVTAGRTSDRLRNPANAPRRWAAPLVKAHAGGFARDIDGYVVDLGDNIGVLRPIAQRPLCGSCHGPAGQIEPAVRSAIGQRYPADRAVGFADGEIRGWFWVELPKSRP